MKKLLCILLALMVCLCAVSFAGCGEETTNGKTSTTAPTATTAASDGSLESELAAMGIVPEITYSDKDYGFQLEAPEKGDTVAIMHTSMGDISIRLFPDECPNTVNNFVELAKAGKYDGVTFHRVIADFMIQGGDFEKGDGTGGTTYDGKVLKDEFCDKLVNLTGSLAMANSGPDTNGSQFFINYAQPTSFSSSESQWAQVKSQMDQYLGTDTFSSMMTYYLQQGYTALYNTDKVDDAIKELYEEHGGNPFLDGAYNVGDRGHTVFAQVYDGMDVVDAICKVEVTAQSNGEMSKPVEDVLIESIEITEYK